MNKILSILFVILINGALAQDFSLEEKAIALSSKLSGKNRFTNNWKKIEEKVYE